MDTKPSGLKESHREGMGYVFGVLAKLLIASEDKSPACVYFKGGHVVCILGLVGYGEMSDDQKRAAQVAAREIGVKDGADGVAFLMEAWQSVRDASAPDDGLRPSERPDRRSVVLIEYQNLDSSPILMSCPCDGNEYDPDEMMRQFDDPNQYDVVHRIADQGWL